MNEFVFRNATFADIPFLVETIVEAEKSGSGVLSYSEIFGLSEEEVRIFIEKMLFEDVDDCELSISSFKVVLSNNRIVGAVSAWIEGYNGVPSVILKGNLLNFVFPKGSIERAKSYHPLLKQLHLDNKKNTIQIGLVYVIEEFRGRGLVQFLLDYHINSLNEIKQNIESIFVQVFSNNTSAIKTYIKYGFEIVDSKKSIDNRIISLLPSNEKFLMKKVNKI
jgi:ribosomal protein S18 acetylase RimI-like enzyme